MARRPALHSRIMGQRSCPRIPDSQLGFGASAYQNQVNAVAVGPTETGALENMMGLSRPQAEVVSGRRKSGYLGRRGTPDDISRWIVSLADPSSDWITGQV